MKYLLLSLMLLPTLLNAQQKMCTTPSLLNLRDAPSTKSNIIKQLPQNTKVILISKNKYWGYVSVNSQYGYLSLKYLGYSCTKYTPVSTYKPTTYTYTPRKYNYNSSQVIYVCNGNYAYAYHSNYSCSGLQRCRGTINKVSASKASMYRSPCKRCY